MSADLRNLAESVARSIWHSGNTVSAATTAALFDIAAIVPEAARVVNELIDRGPRTMAHEHTKEHLVFSTVVTSVWGPIYWRFMHAAVDVTPRVDALRAFILHLKNVLPCVNCRVHWAEALRSFPPPATRAELRQWLSDRHDAVTARTRSDAGRLS